MDESFANVPINMLRFISSSQTEWLLAFSVFLSWSYQTLCCCVQYHSKESQARVAFTCMCNEVKFKKGHTIMCMYVHVIMCVHACVRIYSCVYMHVHVCTCMCMHVYYALCTCIVQAFAYCRYCKVPSPWKELSWCLLQTQTACSCGLTGHVHCTYTVHASPHWHSCGACLVCLSVSAGETVVLGKRESLTWQWC